MYTISSVKVFPLQYEKLLGMCCTLSKRESVQILIYQRLKQPTMMCFCPLIFLELVGINMYSSRAGSHKIFKPKQTECVPAA